MKVSIIVPIYNTAPWLDRCIDSLVNQTYKDIEIILINDGSTDNSRQVCRHWRNNDSRIIYINQDNSGLSAARNAGLDSCRGEYICFVDSDDCVSPFFVEKLLSMCLENGAEIGVCGYELTEENTPVELMPSSMAHFETELLTPHTFFERIYTDKEIFYVIACNKIYSSDIFDGLRFEHGKLNEDEAMIHHTISQCNKIAINYQPLYYYTVRQGSIMKTSQFKPGNMDILQFWQDRMDYFEANGWQTLVYLTMKNYLVKCLELYNKINSDTPDGTAYKNLLMQAYKVMLVKMKKYPVKSKKFVLQMEYYGIFPKKFAGVDRTTFLFG